MCAIATKISGKSPTIKTNFYKCVLHTYEKNNFACNFRGQNQHKTEKKIFGLKKINLLEWLQNLKQHSRPIAALCGKKFDYES